MDRDLVILALNKLLNNNVLEEKELEELKVYLTSGFFLVDMDDETKTNIINSTVDNINEIYKATIIETTKRTFRLRYGL